MNKYVHTSRITLSIRYNRLHNMEYQLTLNWPDFLERHWQKRPVVLKRGFNNFIDPISPDELAGLAMESEVDSRLVSHQDGKWQVSHGPFESYDHLGETNWSLLV